MTIDEAITTLTKIRSESKLGGETVLAVCLIDSELEYQQLETSDDGAIVRLDITVPFLIGGDSYAK